MEQVLVAPDAITTPPSRMRQSLRGEVSISGRGVHSGVISNLTLCPGEPESGIRFCRTDLPGKPVIPANYDYLVEKELDRRTTLRAGDAVVYTIEHVLSALAALMVDDVIVKMDSSEPPFLDGSSLPYADMINRAGLVSTNKQISPIVIEKPLAFTHGDSEICAIPSAGFRVSFFYNSDHPSLRAQAYSVAITPDSYLKEIAPARTFCFFEEIEGMRKAGLIKGANLASAVVIGRKSILNNALRFTDEPVRHKILDFIGDMALLGTPLQGHFMAWRAGHRVNAAFGKHLQKELNL